MRARYTHKFLHLIFDRMDLARRVAATAAMVVCAACFMASSSRTAQGDAPVSFVGGQVCAGCHRPEAALWQGSHHDKAMQEATAQTVLGNFDNATLAHFGVTSTFFRRDGKYFVTTDGPDGAMHDYQIAYTFGVYPLQQYLIAFPGGRHQALAIAWDSRPAASGGQRWFHLYPKDAIPAGDPLHWTGMNQNWNYMCADCHSTNLQRNFDLATNSYRTTWSEIDVSCEACHGPGSRHAAWAKAPESLPKDDNKGLMVLLGDVGGGYWALDPKVGTAVRTAPRQSAAEIETCGLCHSRRREIASGFAYGQPLLDSMMPDLLDAGLYHADGQILDEVYEYGSFLQSRMAAKGVSCSDCHEPHSLALRAPGNQVCGQCHLPAKFDTADHYHHQQGAAGSHCVDCHMPARTYMVVDARRDHAIRIPRPDLSAVLGTPNACNACHGDRSAAWAAEAIAKWYGPNRRVEPHYGTAIEAGRQEEPGADAALIALSMDGGKPAIVRATALSLMPMFSADIGPDTIKAYLAGLQDDDPMIRAAAIGALAPFDPQERTQLIAQLLADKVLAVRIAAARALAGVPAERLTQAQRIDLDRAGAELVAAEMVAAERPEAQLSLGAYYAGRGQNADAEAAYRTALRLDPGFTPALVNLADLYRAMGRESDAEPLLRQAIALQPGYAPAYHALGLLLARQHNLAGALPPLQRAAALAPQDARYVYTYAVALNSAGNPRDALSVLKLAYGAHPSDFDILSALATISRDSGDGASALDYAQRLVQAAPNNQRARALLDSLRAP